MKFVIVSLRDDPFELPIDLLTIKEATHKYPVSESALRHSSLPVKTSCYAYEVVDYVESSRECGEFMLTPCSTPLITSPEAPC